MTTFYPLSEGESASSGILKNQIVRHNARTSQPKGGFRASAKFLVLLIAMLAGLWQGQVNGQTNIFVGTGTVAPSVGTNPGSGANGASPYGICVGSGAMGKKVQIVYTAAQINAAMTTAGYTPGTSYINNVSWDISANIGGTNYSHAGYTIKMANVAQTSFVSAATPYTGAMTTVWGPTAQQYGASGTGFLITHTFATPFQWDGTSSLFVEVCYTISGVGSASTYGAVRRTATASNQMIYNGGASINCATASYATAVAAIPNARFNVSPATPCSGTPNVGAIANATPCPATSATLAITGLAPASGYTYQWLQSDAIGGTYVNASGTSTNSTYSTPTTLPFTTTYYKCDVTCSGSTTRTTASTVTNAAFLGCYCIGTYAAANAGTRGITKVAIASPANPVIDNTSTVLNGGAGATSYTLYTAASPVSNAGLTVSSPYTLAVTVGTQAAASNNVGAWMDYNQNGIFETTEFLGSFASAAQSSTTNINFTVSATALSGTTAMRVRHRYGGAVTSADACTNFTGTAGAGGAGETEDYRIVLTAACSAPSTASTSASTANLLTTSTDLDWTSGNGDGGRIVLLKQGSSVNFLPLSSNTYAANSTFGSGTQLGTGNYCVYNGTGSSASISGLLPSTTYYYSIFEYNTTSTCYMQTGLTGSFTTASCSPSTQPVMVTTCPEYDAINLSFARGNGTHTIILARAGSAVNADPAYNTSYTANTTFGSGDQVGSGNYVIYNGSDPGNVSMVLSGLTMGVAYHFKMYEYNESPNCYNLVSPATFNSTTRSSGVYTSSTTTQNSTTVSQNTLAQQIIGLQVVMGGGSDASANITSITFNTTGTTNTADIVNARIFYTGTSSTYASTTQFGATFTSFAGNLTATDNFALQPGTNYFWVAYDLLLGATISNVLDGTIVSFDLTDNTGSSTKIPSVTAPAGSRSIISSSPSGYCIPSPSVEAVGDCITAAAWSGGDLGSTFTYGGGTSCGSGVNNKTAQAAPTLTPGVTYTLTYYADDFIGNTNSVWIDWDKSGSWSTSGTELVRNSGASFSVSQSVTVPLGTSAGATRMRIMNRFPSAGNNACVTSNGSSQSAVIVDYNVVIAGVSGVQAVSCATPVPTVTTPINYAQYATTSQLTATGTSLLWYTASTGGTGSATAPTPSAATNGTTYYYVSQNTGCESPRTQIAVNVSGGCGYNIISSTGGNGAIAPSGLSVVLPGGSKTYNFYPDCGYEIADVLVDGVSQGVISTYTFTNVNEAHTIAVSFSLKAEICNNLDDDCDGQIDEGLPTFTYYIDVDGDGYSTGVSVDKCQPPANYYLESQLISITGDCNDNGSSVWRTGDFYVDVDGDGYTVGGLVNICYGTNIPGGYSATTLGEDCSDSNNSIWQTGSFYVDNDGDDYDNGSASVCYGNSIPNGYKEATLGSDCNDTNINLWRLGNFFVDNDGDGYSVGSAVELCYGADTPVGYVVTSLGADCTDSNPNLFISGSLYIDNDGDGYGNGTQTVCYGNTIPNGYILTSLGNDCDDANINIYRLGNFYVDNDADGYTVGSAQSICYGLDTPNGYSATTLGEDCSDANPNLFISGPLFIDNDGDGHGNGTQVICYGNTVPNGYILTSLGNDCDDTNINIWQSGALFIDVDNDGYTNGTGVTCYGNTAPPGYKLSSLGSDCNDNNQFVWISGPLFIDNDGDGFVNGTSIVCYGATAPPGFSLTNPGTDCNDNSVNIYPGSLEVCFNLIDDDCDGLVDEDCTIPQNNGGSAAIPVSISGNSYPNCGLLSGSLAAASDSPESAGYTGPDVWYRFIAQSTAVSITVNGAQHNSIILLYDMSFNLLPGNSVENAAGYGVSETLNYTGLTPNVQYMISIGAVTAPAGAFTFCLKHLKGSACADGTNVTYQLCSNTKAQYTGATTYTYNFTPTGATLGSPTSITGGGQVPLSTITAALRYGGTYTLTIDATYSGLTYANGLADTPISVIGTTSSNITILDHASMYTKETQACPATLLRGSILSGKPFVCAAQTFTIEFTKVSNCTGTVPIGFPFEVNNGSASSNLGLGFTTPFQLQNQSYYKVRWRPNFIYGPGSWGTPTVIFMGGAATEGVANLFEAETTEKDLSTEMGAALYPNPNIGDFINLNMTDVQSDNVYVRIMDGMGKVVYTNRYTVDGNLNTMVTFSKPLASGIYLVEFTAGEEIRTERLIISK